MKMLMKLVISAIRLLKISTLLCMISSQGCSDSLNEMPLCAFPEKISLSEYSSEGCHYAFMMTEDDKNIVVIDGKAGPKIDEIRSHYGWYIFPKGNVDGTSILFSPDGNHWAYAAKLEGKWMMIEENKVSQGFDAIGHPVFSTDGQHLAYEAKQSGKWAVVLDNSKGAEYDTIQFDPVFSPDGQHLAYAAKKGDKWVVVIDGIESPEHDKIFLGDPVFSPDSQHSAYAAKEDGKWFVVRDGIQGIKHDRIYGVDNSLEAFKGSFYGVVYSPDSKHLAYLARNYDKLIVVVDGIPGREYDEIALKEPFSPDGNHIVYCARRGKKIMVVKDGIEGQEWDNIADVGPVFSRDSQHLGYMAMLETFPDKWFVVLDGIPSQEYFLVAASKYTFINCDKHFAYTVMNTNAKWSVITDGKESPLYDAIGNFNILSFSGAGPIFSSDGKRIAYVTTKDNKKCVVVDGIPQGEFDAINWLFAIKGFTSIFSPDGQSTAYIGEVGNKCCAVINGKTDQSFDEILNNSIVFSQSGGHSAYFARNGNKWFVIVDNMPIGEYDKVVGNCLMFQKDKPILEYLAVRNNTLYRGEKSLQ